MRNWDTSDWARTVLDDGFVRVVETMGNDLSVCQAARISTGSGSKGEESDKRLISYLMEHRHTGPFEMCEIKLHVRVPMDTWRQWIRHRTASVNEVSSRYKVLEPVFAKTKSNAWRQQATDTKQGSDGFVWGVAGVELTGEEEALHKHAEYVYQKRIRYGVAREQARKDLPLSTYTEAYWKIDLHNLLHFLELRLDDAAQWEIRQYATAIAEYVKAWVPWTWEAFEQHRLETK